MIEALRPYPVYKDSGVPWIGRVPDYWDVTRARNLIREVDVRSRTGAETHLSMSQRLGLVPSSEIDERRLVSESYVGAKLCEIGDLVLNRLIGLRSRLRSGSSCRTRTPQLNRCPPRAAVESRRRNWTAYRTSLRHSTTSSGTSRGPTATGCTSSSPRTSRTEWPPTRHTRTPRRTPTSRTRRSSMTRRWPVS
jgi:hypothetical protein